MLDTLLESWLQQGPCRHDSTAQLLQRVGKQRYAPSLPKVLHQRPSNSTELIVLMERAVWDDPSFVTWHIILQGRTRSATILCLTAAFNWWSIGTRRGGGDPQMLLQDRILLTFTPRVAASLCIAVFVQSVICLVTLTGQIHHIVIIELIINLILMLNGSILPCCVYLIKRPVSEHDVAL